MGRNLILSQLSLILSFQHKVATVLCVAGGRTISKQEESASAFGENLMRKLGFWTEVLKQ